jgi:hypothetical protein
LRVYGPVGRTRAAKLLPYSAPHHAFLETHGVKITLSGLRSSA